MNPLIYLLAAMCALGFAYRVQNHHRRLVAARSYMLLCTITSIAFLCFATHLWEGDLWLRRLFYCITAFVTPALLLFLHKWERTGQFPHKIWYASGGVVVTFITLDIIFREDTYEVSFAEGFLSLWLLCGIYICGQYIWQSIARTQKTDPIRAERLRHLFILFTLTSFALGLEGLLRAFVVYEEAALLDFQSRSRLLQGIAPPVSATLSILFLYVLYLNVTLSRLVDLYELFARLSATALSALVLTGLVAFILYIGSGSPLHFTFHLLLLMLLFLSLYQFLQHPIQQMSSHIFNRPGTRFFEALKDIERQLPKAISIQTLDDALLKRIHETGRCQELSLYLWAHDQSTFRLQQHYGENTELPVSHIHNLPVPPDFARGDILFIEDLEEEEHHALHMVMEQIHAQLCLPLWSEHIIVGWIALRPTPWSDGFSREELRALQHLLQQLSSSLDTIRSIDKLKEQHRLAALGTMSAGLAHEIRNPLAGIKGAAQYLQEQTEQEDLQEFLSLIVSETNRLNTVVSQFLDYARPLQPVLEEHDVNTLISNVIDLEKASERNQKIDYQCLLHPSLSPLHCDANLLHQVVLNLLQNAAQAMEYEGTITVRSQLGSYAYPPYKGQPAINFEINDRGKGIEKSVREKIFIPFFTTKEHGNGLGLAICQRIIESHSGNIKVKSIPQEGTTFCVSLPLLHPPSSLPSPK